MEGIGFPAEQRVLVLGIASAHDNALQHCQCVRCLAQALQGIGVFDRSWEDSSASFAGPDERGLALPMPFQRLRPMSEQHLDAGQLKTQIGGTQRGFCGIAVLQRGQSVAEDLSRQFGFSLFEG